MKKFIVSKNVALATSSDFKNKIEVAVNHTANNSQFAASHFDKKFVGTVVTYNPTNNEVEIFSMYDFVDTSNSVEVNKALENKLANIIKNDDYKQNEFVAFIKASEFEYYGFEGYASRQEQEIRTMKIENKFMSLYIDIISKINEDETSIDEFEFSVRTVNCLKRAGIETVQQIKDMTQEQVMRIRNLGRKSYDELESVLNITFQ